MESWSAFPPTLTAWFQDYAVTEALIVARWPEPAPVEKWESQAVEDFPVVMEVVRAVRNLRAEKNVRPGKRIPATLVSTKQMNVLLSQVNTIAALAYLDIGRQDVLASLAEKPEGCITLVVSNVEIYLPLAGMVDLAEERLRLSKEYEFTLGKIQDLEKLLSGPFAERAPSAVVQKERFRLVEYKETAEKLYSQLKALG